MEPAGVEGRHASEPDPADWTLEQTTIADMIAFAAFVIERPAAFLGRRIGLASDELRADGGAAALSRVLHRDIEAEPIAIERLAPPLRALFARLERTGHAVDLEALRRPNPDVGWHRYGDRVQAQVPRFADRCPRPTPSRWRT